MGDHTYIHTCRHPDSHTCCFLSFSFVYLEIVSLFSSIFVSYIAVFSLHGEYVVSSFLPDGVFLPCDHGLDFLHHFM